MTRGEEQLRRIQALEFLKLGSPPSWQFDLEYLKSVRDNFRSGSSLDHSLTRYLPDDERLESLLRSCTNPFENPLLYPVLTEALESVQRVAVPLYGERSVTIGSIPTRVLNAMVGKVQNSDEYIIVVSGETIIFCDHFTQTLGELLPEECVDTEWQELRSILRQSADERPALIESFSARVLHNLQEGYSPLSSEFLPWTGRTWLSSRFRNSMEFFIVGHEYGHILAGDCESQKITAFRDAKYHANQWRKEFGADETGALLANLAGMNNVQDHSPGTYCVGADLFLLSQTILELASHYIVTGTVPSKLCYAGPPRSSHPPALNRYFELRSRTERRFSEEEKKVTGKYQEAIWAATITLLDVINPHIERIRSEGSRLHPMWEEAARLYPLT